MKPSDRIRIQDIVDASEEALSFLISIICLLIWIIVPFLLSSRFFKKKDF